MIFHETNPVGHQTQREQELAHRHVSYALPVIYLCRVEQNYLIFRLGKRINLIPDKVLILESHQLMGKSLPETGTLNRRVFYQEAQHLGKVRLTRTIETTEPDTRFLHIRGKLVEEIRQVGGKTLGKDKTIEFFLYFILALQIEIDYILDVIVQLDGQNIFDFHLYC